MPCSGCGCFATPTRPAGNDGGIEPLNDADTEVNLMFVTSTARPGNQLTSAAEADGACQTAATAAGVPGTFLAWVSYAGGVSPAVRLGAKRGGDGRTESRSPIRSRIS